MPYQIKLPIKETSILLINDMQREQLLLARRRKGIFRLRVENTEHHCRLTDVSIKEYLIASHIKPWRNCTSEEMLDGNNGLLMCPHIGFLFDRGFIGFTDDGELLVSKQLDPEILGAWNIHKRNVGSFNSKQIQYILFHLEFVFKG